MRHTIFGFAVAVFLGLIILGAGCSFDEPINPRWDMQLVIPLSEQRYTLSDLVDTSTALDTLGAGIALTDDSLLYFFYQDSISRIEIGDSIYIPPQHDIVQSGLDKLDFATGLDQEVQFSFGSINPDVGVFQGQTVVVPTFDFEPITQDLDPLDNLQYAIIDSGYLHYTVTNGLPVPITQVRFRLFPTQSPSHTIVDETLGAPLPAGGSVTDSVTLQGSRLEQFCSIEIFGSSPGSSPNSVLVDTSDGITIQTTVGMVTVIEAVGKVPEQTISKDSLYSLESEHEIHSAGVQRGSIHLHSFNETALTAHLKIRVSNFTSPLGDTLEREMEVAPHDSIVNIIDLTGYTLRIPDPSNQVLHAYLEAQVDSSDGWIYYNNGQDVFATMETDTVFLSYVDGVLSPITIDIPPSEEAVEQIPEGWEQLNFVGASLSIDLNSDLSVPILTDIHLVAWREGIPRDSVLIQRTIVPNVDTLLVISGLEQLLDDRPDTLKFWGTAGMSGDIYLEATNYIEGQIEVDIPLSFTATPTTVNGDIEEIDEAIDKDKQVNGATVETTIHNHLPLSGSVVVLVAHDSTLFRTNPSTLDTLISVNIVRPTISGGRVTEEVEFDVDITLTDEQIDWFRTVPVYTRTIFHLDGTEGDTLSAYGSDYLGFSAIGRFIYEVDTE